MKTFLVCFVAGLVLFPTVGHYLAEPVVTVDHAAFCSKVEEHGFTGKEEAERYLDYCPHFDMKTQTEVPGRKTR